MPNNEKRIFISWTGKQGSELAKSLKEFLAQFLDGKNLYVSEDNILPGQEWRAQLNRRLGKDQFGILVMTSAALESSWILFEAGALSSKPNNCIIPFLFGVKASQLPSPLTAYQALVCTPEGTWRLIQRLRSLLGGVGSDQDIVDETTTPAPQDFGIKWEPFCQRVTALLSKDIEIKNEPEGSGEYFYYFLSRHLDTPVHRAYLKLGVDANDNKKAFFKNCYDEYRGDWHQAAGEVSIELINVTDSSDRILLLLKRHTSWMWGVYCALANSKPTSVAGRCFLSPREQLLPLDQITTFITEDACDKETKNIQIPRPVTNYLKEPVDSILTCNCPLSI
jgi:hypothetical protein